MTNTIFISYRRERDHGTAGRLNDQLEAEFGKGKVFFDVDGFLAGDNFVRKLPEFVAECDIFLAVIGRQWIDARDEEGNPRLANPHDWVRIEIESALRMDKRVIPILVDNASMPRPEALPTSLAPMTERQARRLTHDRFRADVQGLIKDIATIRVREEERRRDAERQEAERQCVVEAVTRRRQEEAERKAEERRRQETEQQRRVAEAEARARQEEAEREAEERRQEQLKAVEELRRQKAEQEADERRREAERQRTVETEAHARREQVKREAREREEAIRRFAEAGEDRGNAEPVPEKGDDIDGHVEAAEPGTARSVAQTPPQSTGGARLKRSIGLSVAIGTVVVTIVAGIFVVMLDRISPANDTETNSTASRASLIDSCDRLAAAPGDEDRPSRILGVPFTSIDTIAAVFACRAAIDVAPSERRIAFQLGRAFLAADQFSKARYYFNLSADLGSKFAMYTLGVLYDNGQGVTRDYDTARTWYQKAANLGNADAMYNLGVLYANGRGVAQDYVTARGWYQTAADLGNENAKKRLAELKRP